MDGRQGTEQRPEVESPAHAGGLCGLGAGAVGAQQEAAAEHWPVAGDRCICWGQVIMMSKISTMITGGSIDCGNFPNSC